MKNVRFSIVIPTRERHETLGYTLRTCLAQNFEDYEIIVSDNYSSPATKEVVDSFQSAKIKYIRSSQPLAMSRNWELAVSHASGEYVIVLGDDDGLLFHALSEIDRLIQTLGVKVLRWERVYYRWPNVIQANYANRLMIPTERESVILNSQKIISKVLQSKLDYTFLPMFYNSAIHQDLIQLLREKTEYVFNSLSPDVYSGFAFAYLAQSYLSVGRPMSINGGSAKSNGIAHSESKNLITEEFERLNREAGLEFHPQIPNLPGVKIAAIAESFQRVKDALFPNELMLSINRKLLVEKCILDLRVDSQEEWVKNMGIIRESLSDNIKLQKWFDAKILNFSCKLRQDYLAPKWKKGFKEIDFDLDASYFGVKDVFGVAELCEKLMGYTENEFEWNHGLKFWQKRLKRTARMLLKGY